MLHPLEILKDRITESKIIESGKFMDAQDLAILQEYIPDFHFYIPKLNQLYLRLGTTLNIIDYDDTLQHRHYQLQDGRLQDNRWKAGNRVIDEVIGRELFLETHYKKDSVVRRIAQILEMQSSRHAARILTAWESGWQTSKTKQSWVYDRSNGIITVGEWHEKIKELLDIIIELGYIPSKIIIYEDRPEHFIRAAQALWKFLWGVEIVVNHVILSQKEVIKRQIEEIRQWIYISK